MVRPALAAALVLLPSAAPQDGHPPARALSLELTAAQRLAGTRVSLRGAAFVQRVLEEAGFQVQVDERVVLLSLPRRIALTFREDAARREPFHERIERFDPDAHPPGDVPPFNAWTASGTAVGEVVDAGRGTRADFERLRAARIDLAGKVALCRYGGGYRGIKVALAQEFGCAAVLLYSAPADDGAERGPVWPQGPWKPPHEAQRGAIGPMARGPGDPSTPGFPSPAPGEALPAGRERLAGQALAERLPAILATPIGAGEAALLLERLALRRVLQPDGSRASERLGPGPVTVELTVDAPRELRPIRNVIGRLAGARPEYVLAGNHRDAWVRGAHDAGSGTVSLLRAAQHLDARRRAGWRPAVGIALAFWDAEESGLIGSTEWGEARETELGERCVAYVNADAVVSGLALSVSGAPGLEGVLARALSQVSEPTAPGGGAPGGAPGGEPPGERTLLDQWREAAEGVPRLSLPGSGSDFTVFLHHLGIPVLDLSLRGNGGGHYHTAFDDFAVMDRFLDPGWVGHETAGRLLAALIGELATLGRLAIDDAWAAGELARHAEEGADWMGAERARKLSAALRLLSRTAALSWTEWRRLHALVGSPELGPLGTWPSFLETLSRPQNRAALEAGLSEELPPPLPRALLRPAGLEGRPWYRNPLWAPGLETGYGAETFPRLRAAAAAGDGAALEAAHAELVGGVEALAARWQARADGLAERQRPGR